MPNGKNNLTKTQDLFSMEEKKYVFPMKVLDDDAPEKASTPSNILRKQTQGT